MRAAIVLAAGASRRFGRRDKLGARLAGQALLTHAVARARESGAQRVILVARPGAVCRDRRLTIVYARDAHRGLSASLRAGLAALRPIEREVVILLGDMPLAAMPRRFGLRAGIDAVRPMFAGRPGHPMLVRVSAARRALRDGDRGLAGTIDPARVAGVAGRAGNLIDIDTPSALCRLRRRIVGGQGAFR